MKKIFQILLMGIAAVSFVFGTNAYASKNTLLGAGATFPYPLYSKMFKNYYKQTSTKVNYQAIGSGGGIKQMYSQTVDFGGSDAFMSDKELSKASGKILHIPTCLGAVVLSYNLPGKPKLKLTGDVIAKIFLGKIKKWNDRRIKKLNPNVKLPKMKITVVHRSDGSGTTFIFSDYLKKVSKTWAKKIGRGKSLNWPVGIGGKGNPGVAGYIKQLPGSFGYVELIYALKNNMPYALLKNKSGNYINPSLESVSLAANIDIPDDTRVSITDTDAKKGYPISSFTWMIFYQEQHYKNRSLKQAQNTIKLLNWVVHEGQQYNKSLDYAPLPTAAVKKAEKIIKSATYDGKALLK